jgi:hypothetical protein
MDLRMEDWADVVVLMAQVIVNATTSAALCLILNLFITFLF